MKNKKILNTLMSLGLITSATIPVALVVSCGDDKKNINSQANWDKDIKINYRWYNPGFMDTDVQTNFEKFISDKFNEIKNKDEKLKSYDDVTISFVKTKDKDVTLSDLNSNKKDMDFAALPYSFLKEKMPNVNQLDSDLKAQVVSQSATLKFTWSSIAGNSFYDKNDSGKKLMDAAKEENKIQFSAPYGEFPTWNDENKDPYFFDGSKYTPFYLKETDKDNLTYIYHGAIYISGDKATRSEIIKNWKDKDYDKFLKHGIVYEDSSSGGGFKYQAALLAKHFNKSLKDVYEDLTSDSSAYKDNILKGKDKTPASYLGKDQSGKTYNIGFSDEGEFNWTPKTWGADLFKPTDFPNKVVRVLTLTNPAPYDLLLARSGMNKDQVRILQQVFDEMSILDNKFGIYTGMNKFISTNLGSVKNFYNIQSYAEGETFATIPTIPEIK